jgi:heme exporter protein D
MFWSRYGGVIGWLFLVGVLTGAVLLLVVFGLLDQPDPGEEGAVVLMPFYGAAGGAVIATAASLSYWLGMSLWNRQPGRSVSSRAGMGALSAGAGAAMVWILYGFATSGGYGAAVWSVPGIFCALVAALTAGPLTRRAARLADSEDAESALPRHPFSNPAAWSRQDLP